jgi:ABC-type transport system involved in multi-copper enzyme maturation permease subunit
VSVSPRRVRAIVRKELREYRRHPSIVVSMAIFPLIFLIQPLVLVLLTPATTATTVAHEHLLLYMLAVPVLTPPMLAAYSVAGERQQGTLEPVLTTPIPREEFLVGKALAVLVPSIAVAYAVYVVFLTMVVLFARPGLEPALVRGPDVLVQVVFTPLLAAWSTWVGIAISTRSGDIRVAQQLSLLANLPLVLVTSLIAFNVIHITAGLAVGLGVVLVSGDAFGWRIVSPMFDRERLITGSR